MKKENNVNIFEDTIKICNSNQFIKENLSTTIKEQKYILERDFVDITNKKLNDFGCKIIVSKKRTFDAASIYKDKKVCVLNFASSTSPGGGVTRGSNAQEESLCRISNLYPALNCKMAWDCFYKPHRTNHSFFATNDCIYSPNIIVFKSDTNNPIILNQNDWYKVNVITCAAPNLRPIKTGHSNEKISEKQLFDIQYERICRIMDIAIENDNKILILGAFGCGVFMNNPYVVAMAMRKALKEREKYYDIVEFAIYCDKDDEENYNTFKRVFK